MLMQGSNCHSVLSVLTPPFKETVRQACASRCTSGTTFCASLRGVFYQIHCRGKVCEALPLRCAADAVVGALLCTWGVSLFRVYAYGTAGG